MVTGLDSADGPPQPPELPAHRFSVALFDAAVTVGCSSREIAASARTVLDALVTTTPHVAPGDAIALYAEHDGYVIATTNNHREAFGTRARALDALEFLTSLRLLSLTSDLVHLHASGAARSGRSVLALGPPGAGKSSIALHWSRMGLPVIGDDVALIDRVGLAHSFRRLFKVDAARLAYYGSELSVNVGGPPETEVWYDPRTGGGWSEPTPIGTVALVRRESSARLTVEPLEPSETLTLLLSSLLPTGLGAAASFERMATIAESARGVRVVFADAAEAGEALLEYA